MAVLAAASLVAACRFEPLPLPGTPTDGAAADTSMEPTIDGPRSDWWDPAWTHRRRITIDTTMLSGNVTNFPLLVRLPAEIFPAAHATGRDLRVLTFDNTTELPFEIDTIDEDRALLWVRVPELVVGTPAVGWVYYGNPAATQTRSNGVAVFADGYVSVFHLAGLLADVTGRHGLNLNGGCTSPPAAPSSMVGGARSFNGTNQCYELGNLNTDFDFTTSMTVSAWVQVDTFTSNFQAIVTKGDSSWRMHRAGNTNVLGYSTGAGAAADNQAGATDIEDDQWHHVAVTYGGGMKRIYVDGVQDAVTTAPAITTNNRPVNIGRNNDMNGRVWNGLMDEVRISGAEYNAARIHAEFLTVGSEELTTVGADEPYAPGS